MRDHKFSSKKITSNLRELIKLYQSIVTNTIASKMYDILNQLSE